MKPELTVCPQCRVEPGKPHEPGCGVERCPFCRMQLIGCPCVYKVNGMNYDTLDIDYPDIYGGGPTEEMWKKFDAEVQKKGGPLIWEGEWPGVKECRERGWYCQDGFGPDHRWGSFCPCPPDAPGAREDLNRLAWFYATGKDTKYDGCTRVPRTS